MNRLRMEGSDLLKVVKLLSPLKPTGKQPEMMRVVQVDVNESGTEVTFTRRWVSPDSANYAQITFKTSPEQTTPNLKQGILWDSISLVKRGVLDIIFGENTTTLEQENGGCVIPGVVDWPLIPIAGLMTEQAVWGKHEFSETMANALKMSSDNELETQLFGVAIKRLPEDASITEVVSTDRHRLYRDLLYSVNPVDFSDDDEGIIIPKIVVETCSKLIDGFKGPGTVTFEKGEYRWCRFKGSQWEIVFSPVDSKLPNYQRVIPDYVNMPHWIRFPNRVSLLDALQSLKSTAREDSYRVVYTLDGNECRLESKHGDNKAFFKLPITTDVEIPVPPDTIKEPERKDTVFAMDCRFMIHALNSLEGTSVVVCYDKALSPFVIPENDKVIVLMPQQVWEGFND